MTLALLIGLFMVVLAFLVILDRRDARAKAERDGDREERQLLLQRIQAPEAAVYEHATRDQPDDPSSLPYTDEELAEQEEQAVLASLAVARIEAMENGAWPG